MSKEKIQIEDIERVDKLNQLIFDVDIINNLKNTLENIIEETYLSNSITRKFIKNMLILYANKLK